MSDPEQTKILPKLGRKTSPANPKPPGIDMLGTPPRIHKNGQTNKSKLAHHGGVSILFEKYVDKGTGNVVVARLVHGTGFAKKNLAGTLGISVDALYRKDRINSPTTQARMREMLEILGRILDWAGDEVQAMAWYRAQPIPAFGGRTAESLVKSNQTGPLRDYLDHVGMGGFA